MRAPEEATVPAKVPAGLLRAALNPSIMLRPDSESRASLTTAGCPFVVLVGGVLHPAIPPSPSGPRSVTLDRRRCIGRSTVVHSSCARTGWIPKVMSRRMV